MVYILNGKTNIQIKRELSKKFQAINLKKINWPKQFYSNKIQLNNIVDGYQLSKKVKAIPKNIIKRKANQKTFYLNKFISQTKDISIDNLKINLLKSERDKVYKIENQYEKDLEYEKKSLNKDEEDFDQLKQEIKSRIKEDEEVLNKLISIYFKEYDGNWRNGYTLSFT